MNDKLTKNHPDTMRFFNLFIVFFYSIFILQEKLSNDTLLTKITAHSMIHSVTLSTIKTTTTT